MSTGAKRNWRAAHANPNTWMLVRRSLRRAAVALGALLLVPSLALAGIENVGTTSANFLALGTGARALGMGGATLGMSGDLNAAAWNPGALGALPATEVMFSHAALAEQCAQEWVTAGGRLGHSPVRWSLSGIYQSEGTFEGRDALNNPTAGFEVSSLAVGGQVASSVGEHVTVGLGVKWARESLGPGVAGSGFTFDGGVLVRAGDFGVGLAAQNVGGQMAFDSQSYPFPSNVGLGVSYAHRSTGLRAALDYNVPSAYYSDVRGGLEWRWRDHVALRTGYRLELGAVPDDPLGGPTFGVGAGAAGLWFDYGYVLTGSGEGRHHMGISFSPGKLAWGSRSLAKGKTSRGRDDSMLIGPPKHERGDSKKQ